MKSAANKPTHVTRGNVLDDLGFSPEQATALKFKAELYQAILKCAKKYSQKELQIILGEPQPRVSELLNGKIANKTVASCFTTRGAWASKQRPNSRRLTKKWLRKNSRWLTRQPSGSLLVRRGKALIHSG
jgi:predicted XRE-type DNA-binding protein